MNLSNIKMVVSDMDGTLLNSNHEVSNRFFEQFQELKKRNIQFVAASGRQYHSMAEKLQKIKDDIIFISENGAFVKKGDEELSVTPIKQSLIQEILEIIDSIDGGYAMLCGKYKSYLDGSSRSFLEQIKEYYSCYEVVNDYTTVTDEIVKIAVYHRISAEEYIYPKTTHLSEQVKVKVSGPNWVDLNHVEAHKGNALQEVMNSHNIKSDEVLIFGDYNNDIEMLQLSEYSFAMANAHPNVKKVARYETSSHNDFGVERILEKLL
ncbi:HAD family hydrolase [Flagellimonas sp.]|uniref:HAD family hydrolase n=1 Tax=Flagellimonas sp. TaxID=2058762 RepID=UPI003F49DDCA